MQVQSHVGRDVSADTHSQHTPFIEPRPPRTPDRSDPSQQSKPKSPPSSHKRASPKIIRGTTGETLRLQQRPGRVPDQTVPSAAGPEPTVVPAGENRAAGHQWWPSPAKTHLGTHIQNCNLGMEKGCFNTYRSPILPVKQQKQQEEDSSKNPQQQQLQMNQSRLSTGLAQKQEPEFARETGACPRTLTDKSPLVKNSHSGLDTALSYEQASTTLNASRNNWMQCTPYDKGEKLGLCSVTAESPYAAEHAQFHAAGPHQCNFYPPYAPLYQCPNPYTCGAQGSCNSHEYASRGYPQMGTPPRHAIYAPAHQYPYYYEGGQGPYPMPPPHILSAYYPPPSGHQMNPPGYYDHPAAPGSKYHHAAAMSRGGPVYPPCLNEHYEQWPAAGLHPYHLAPHGTAYSYDESPPHLVAAMRSPHMPQPHVLSVHKSNTKSQRRSGDSKNMSIERQSCNAGGARGRTAQLHPRQLNFNDELVDCERNRIHFEEVDASEEGPDCDQPNYDNTEQNVPDNDDDDPEHFEVVKIKLNSHPNDQKSRFAPQHRHYDPPGHAPTQGVSRGRVDDSYTENSDDCDSNLEQIQALQASAGSVDQRHTTATGTRMDQRHRNGLPSFVSIKSSPKVSNNMLNKQATPEKPARISQSLTSVKPREEEVPSRLKMLHDQQQKMMQLEVEPARLKIAVRDDESQSIGVASSSICKSLQSSAAALNNPKKRGYMFNEASGQLERVIRKRKRKTTFQLEELANAFDAEPHWTKEMLAEIAIKTELTEAQVYKWGWDQKRKKYGVAEAERMRQYENILDQQNARKAASLIEKMPPTGPCQKASQPVTKSSSTQKRQPEITPENRSNEASSVALGEREQARQIGAIELNHGQGQPHQQLQHQQKLLDKPAKPLGNLHASAEQAFYAYDSKASVQVSAFNETTPLRQQLTVEKPSNGLNNDILQKSAKTNTNTVQVSLMSGNPFTPKDKHPPHISSDVDNYSDKFTPENAAAQNSHIKQARAEKLQTKDTERLKRMVGPAPYPQQLMETPQNKVATKAVVPRKTRQQASILKQQEEAAQQVKEDTGADVEQPGAETRSRRPRRSMRSKANSSFVASVEE